MKLINADAFIAALESFSDRAHDNQHYLNGIETAKELIAEADEAVVRCKDCAKMQHDTIFGRWYCKGKRIEPNDYCSYGERRTDER